MKLESTLRRRSGFLHTVPVIDGVLMLLLFFLLGSNFTLQSGVNVTLPESPAVLRPLKQAHEIVISAATAETPATLTLDGTPFFLPELADLLEAGRAQSAALVIRADRLTGYGTVFEVQNIALTKGFTVALAASPAPGAPFSFP